MLSYVNSGEEMKFLLKYLKKYRRPFSLGIIFLSLEATCDLLQPTIMSNLIDNGVKEKDLNHILTLSTIMLGVTLMGALFALSRNYLASTVSQKFSHDLRLDVFKKVQVISFESIDHIEQASLITRLTNDITQIQNFSFGIMRVFFKAPILCVGAIIMMLLLSPKMTLILVVVFPLAILLIALSMKIGYPYFLKVQTALDHMNTVLREYLTGVRVVKAFNSYQYEEERFKKANISLADATIKTMRIMAIFSPGIALTVNLGIAALLYIGAIQVNNNALEVGKIMAFVMFMTQILNSLSMMTNIFNMLIRARASSARVGEILNAESANGITNIKRFNLTSPIKLEFKKVSYSYKGQKGLPVLKDISFKCQSGDTIGIIGSTGAGKSTLLNLLLRFYDVTTGEILLNDINIVDLNLHELRDLIGIVPQKSVLFSGTIMENLIMSNEKATEEDISLATTTASAKTFIESFPESYHTIIGQSGVNLSGGQKQRISLARVLIKKPEILILDDATSAIDVTTEKDIRDGLKKYLSQSMAFIVSQRISSIMDCDKIIVLENGEIVGFGSHDELISSCVVYKDIYLSQIGKDLI